MANRNKGKSIIGFPNDYVLLDLETTGLDPEWDEIIEIGAIRYSNGEMVDSFSTLVKPEDYYIVELDEDDDPNEYAFKDGKYYAYVPSFITELTGITNQMLVDAPDQKSQIEKLIDFIGDSKIIGHNVNFDINFVYDTYHRYFGKEFHNDFIDTMRMARKLLRQLPHHRLKDICTYYSIDYSKAHRALSDCEMTQMCFIKLKDDALSEYGTEEVFIDQFKKHRGWNVKDIVGDESMVDEDSPIYKKEVVITGTLEKMARKEALQMIANIGGIPKNSVTKTTNYLVIANKEYNQETDKKKKARNLILKGSDLEIISENVFYDMLGLE